MKVRTVWMSKGLILLWSFHFTFCTASKYDPNEVCVEKYLSGNETLIDCYPYGFAYFGRQIHGGPMEGVVVLSHPRSACSEVKHKSDYNQSSYTGYWFLLIDADDCDFDDKGFRATQAGFDAAIIRSLKSNDVEPIGGGSDADKVNIPVVYVGKATGEILEQNDFTKKRDSRIFITAQQYPPIWDYEFYMIPFAVIVGICFVLMAMFMISRYYRHYLEQRRSRLSPTNLRKIPTKKFKKGDDYYDVCAICLEEYKDGERLRILPCEHAYHCKCVDPWLTEGKRTCPVCKRPVSNDRRSRARNRRDRNDVESGSGETTHDADETTPLIGSTSASVASNSLTV